MRDRLVRRWRYRTMRHACLTRRTVGGMDIRRLLEWANHGNIPITAGRHVHLMIEVLSGGGDIVGTHGTSAIIAVPNEGFCVMRNLRDAGANRPGAATGTIN
jgi:hypothetical protein